MLRNCVHEVHRESELVEQKGNSFVLLSCKIAHKRRKAKEGFQTEVEVDGKTKENWQKSTATCPTANRSAKLALAAFSDRGGEDGDEEDYGHDDHLRL